MGVDVENPPAKPRPALVSWDSKTQTRQKFLETTLSAQAEALILQCVTPFKWKLVSGDIKTAFLSGGEETF